MSGDDRTGSQTSADHPTESLADGLPTVRAPRSSSLPPRDGGRYQVLAEHGRGGLGRILRVVDRDLDRVVAIKELIARGPDDEARFAREIRMTARLQHPGIVPIHDAGYRTEDGRPFYTMKLVGGAPLRDLVAGCETVEARLALVPHVLAIADALAYAHSRGIIHRDLKPANVIVGEFGETVVIDWGLAKEIDEPDDASPRLTLPHAASDEITVAGEILGTPAFMSPEQARGGSLDARADVYSIGAIAYHVLSGHYPYGGKTGGEVLQQLLAGPPRPLREREPRVPVDLAAIVDKAMARAPADRYPSARELAGDLRRYEAGRFVEARRYRWWEPTVRWVRRHGVIAGLLAAFVLVGALGLAVAFGREQGLRRLAERERGRAEAQTQALLEEQARRELDAGRPQRAGIYLAAALRRAPDRRVLRWLLSEAAVAARSHVRTLLGHTADVVSLAFSPDGATLATGSSDLTVRLWDVATGQERARLLGHQRSLEAVAWSPDGTMLASADSNDLRIWKADGTLIRTLPKGAYQIGWARDGRRIYAGWHDGRMRGWEIATGADLAMPQVHTDRISTITYDGAGRLVTSAWDGRIIIWDTTGAAITPQRTLDDHRAPIRLVTFSADGALLLTGDEEGTLHVRDGVSLEVLHSLRLPAASHATGAWFGPGGDTIMTSSADGSLRIWHATSGHVLRTIDAVPEGKLFDSSMSPDGSLVAIASLRQVDLFAPSTGADHRVLAGSAHQDAGYDPGALSADGRYLASARMARDRSHQVRLWDTRTGALVGAWPETGNPYSLAISPDGARIVTGDMDNAPPRLRDARTGALIATLTGHDSLVVNVAYAADGAWIATASYDGTVRLWRGDDGRPVEPVIRSDKRPTAVALSPDGAHLAVTDKDGGVTLYDRATGAVLQRFAAHSTWIEDVEFSADGARLITACRQDHTARIWDLADPTTPVTLVGHADNLSRAELSRDGALAATASADDTARIWDAHTGELLRTFSGPSETAALSPDGTTLYTTGIRDHAVAWRLTVDERPADQLAAEVEDASPWRLDAGRLVPKQPLGP